MDTIRGCWHCAVQVDSQTEKGLQTNFAGNVSVDEIHNAKDKIIAARKSLSDYIKKLQGHGIVKKQLVRRSA